MLETFLLFALIGLVIAPWFDKSKKTCSCYIHEKNCNGQHK